MDLVDIRPIRDKCHSAGGRGGPRLFFFIGILIFMVLTTELDRIVMETRCIVATLGNIEEHFA
jgi:hypothetical protein